jgi:TPR repeat protein
MPSLPEFNGLKKFNIRHRIYKMEYLAKDCSSAFCWFYKAAEVGDARSAYILGSWYERGGVVTRNIEEARRWLRKGCEPRRCRG